MERRINNIIPKIRKASTDQSNQLSEVGTITSNTYPTNLVKSTKDSNFSSLTTEKNLKMNDKAFNSNTVRNNVRLLQKKMMEASSDKGLNKKIKVLNDNREKAKVRFTSLLEILESIPDFEKSSFYLENAEAIAETVGTHFIKLVSKIKQRGNVSINSKEIISLYKTFPILKQMFLHLKDKIKQGWQEETLLVLLTQLLHYGNHLTLRKHGLELLLLWISILKSPNEGPLWLYRNCITLDVYAFDRLELSSFSSDSSRIGYSKMGQELIHVDDRTPLVLNPSPQSFQDSNNLFQVLLKNLLRLAFVASCTAIPSSLELKEEELDEAGFPSEDYHVSMGMDAAYASVKFMFLLFQNFYLAKLFPTSGQPILSPATQVDFLGLQLCPPSLLKILISFLVQNCIDDGFKLEGFATTLPGHIRSSPACPILKKLLFSTNVSREFINDILRQALGLTEYGFNQQCMETARGAILIIGSWLLCDENEKPIFLRSNYKEDNQSSEYNYESYVLFYLKMLQSAINFNIQYSIMDKNPSGPKSPSSETAVDITFDAERKKGSKGHQGKASLMEFTEHQLRCYEEIFLILRGIITDRNRCFNQQCKKYVCEILLELNERFLHLLTNDPQLILLHASGRFESKSKILVQALDILYETLFYAWSLSHIEDKGLWLRFQRSLIKSTGLPSSIQSWCSTLRKLTRILANKLYSIDLDYNKSDLNDLLSFGVRRANRVVLKKQISKKELIKNKDIEIPEVKEPKRTSFSNKKNVMKKSLSVSHRPNSRSGFKLSIDENNDTSSNSNNTDGEKAGFYALSEYHRLIVVPELPRSSISSVHSVNTQSSSLSVPSNTVSPSVTKDGSLPPPSSEEAQQSSTIQRCSTIGFCIFDHSFNRLSCTEINFNSIEWDTDSILFLWKNILSCLGNINEIKSSHLHEISLRCIVDVYDALQNVRSFRTSSTNPVPCLKEMSIWIIGATELPTIYEGGKHVAFEWMCRTLSLRRAHDAIVLLSEPLSFYYQVLKALLSKDSKLFQTVVEQATFAFSRMLPGINILAPTLIDSIQFMLEDPRPGMAGRVRLPEVLKQKSLTMLISLLHLPYQFEGMTVHTLTRLQNLQRGDLQAAKVADLGDRIQQILLKLLEEDEWSSQLENYPTTYSIAICGLCLQTTLELSSAYAGHKIPNKGLIRRNLTPILDQLYSSHSILANTAIDCVASFAASFDSLYSIDKDFIRSIFEDLVGAIKVHLNLLNNNSSNQARYVLTRLFACLLEWLMVAPSHISLDAALKSSIIGVLERAVVEAQTKGLMSSDVSDAAQVVLFQLANHFGQDFRIQPKTSLELDLQEQEMDNESLMKCNFFAYNDNIIIAIHPSDHNGIEKAMFRNFLGKFVWEFLPIEEDIRIGNNESEKNHNEDQVENSEAEMIWSYPIKDDTKDKSFSNNDDESSEPYFEFHEPPKFDKYEPLLDGIDMLESALDFVEQSFEDHGYGHWVRTTPNRKVMKTPTHFSKASSHELQFMNHPNKDGHQVNTSSALHNISHFPIIKEHQMFMAHLQMLHPDQPNQYRLAQLTRSEAFLRDLKALDRKHSREIIKIALIYVRDGQCGEESILKNESGSAAYTAFTESLGWVVDLATHAGYLGGLERSGANGSTSIYYSNAMVEIMYHDVTRMPNDPRDVHQVKKKRHVGNDPVHIVWNESSCDYSPFTIGGDFGNAQIIIHPIKDDLFDIRIFRDGQCGHFGPLISGMVVPKVNLSSLVRCTAINAYRSILCRSLNYHYNALHPSIERNHEIHAIIRKFKNQETDYLNTMKQLFRL